MLFLVKKAAPEWQGRDRVIFESAATLESHNKKYGIFFRATTNCQKKHKKAKTKKKTKKTNKQKKRQNKSYNSNVLAKSY